MSAVFRRVDSRTGMRMRAGVFIKPRRMPDYLVYRTTGPRFYDSTYKGRRERTRGPCGHLGKLTRETITERRTRIGRVTVKLSMLDDYPHGDVCMAEVYDEHAHEWAESDGYIGGSSWESDGEGSTFVWAMPNNDAKTVEELCAQGYRLDLSEYLPPEVMPEQLTLPGEPCPVCKDAGRSARDARNCPWLEHNRD